MTEQNNKKVIVVLGAGRTGTSLLMQVLSQLGMSVSPDMTPPSEQNPEGGFEDREIFSLHSQMLSALNTNQLFPLPEGWLDCPEIIQAKGRLQEILLERMKKSTSIFGFKDPRTAMFLPVWKQIFNPQKIVPVYVLAVRSPASTVNSLAAQYNQNKSISELFWMNKYCDALMHTGGNCFIVHYEDWFKDSTEQADKLLKYTGLDQYYTGDKSIVGGIVKPSLNRSVYASYEVQNTYVQKLYDTLRGCKGVEWTRGQLMETVNECVKAMDEFKGWYTEAQRVISKHAKQNKKDLQPKIEKLTLQNNEYLKQVKDLHDEKEELRKKLSSYHWEKENLNKELNCYQQKFESTSNINNSCESRQPKHKNVASAKNNAYQSKTVTSEQKWCKEALELRNSTSFRLGQTLVNAMVKPGKNTLIMPFRMVKIVFDDLVARKSS